MYFPTLLATATALATSALAQTTTLATSTCSPQSAAACPTPYDPCCAFLCAEAQVPFQVCLPTDQTVLASCTACPSPAS